MVNHNKTGFMLEEHLQNSLEETLFTMRERFELLSRVEYFDFRPRREAYLKEAFA